MGYGFWDETTGRGRMQDRRGGGDVLPLISSMLNKPAGPTGDVPLLCTVIYNGALWHTPDQYQCGKHRGEREEQRLRSPFEGV
jgi:hypothetical protein